MRRAESLGHRDPDRGPARDAGETPWRHLPNAITGLRLLLVPPAAFAIATGRNGLALALVLFAGVSDGVDGYLAKRFDWQSRFGALFDPVADKLLFVSVFVLLAIRELLPVWLVGLVVGRDAVIVSGAMGYRWIVGPFPGAATVLSKANTGVLVLLGCTVLAAAAAGVDYRDTPAPVATAIVLLGATACCTTVLSGALYVTRWSRRARRALAERGRSPHGGRG
jgi:cardiolipin synthase